MNTAAAAVLAAVTAIGSYAIYLGLETAKRGETVSRHERTLERHAELIQECRERTASWPDLNRRLERIAERLERGR
jgi:hypothetical protein